MRSPFAIDSFLQHRHPPRSPSELGHGEANRTNSYHQSGLPLPNFAAAYCMRANPESFDQGKLFQREFFRLVQKRQRNRQELLHPAIQMNTDHAKAFAAVGAACQARFALSATNIRFDRTAIAGANTEIICADFDDFSGKFVPKYSGIRIDGTSAVVKEWTLVAPRSCNMLSVSSAMIVWSSTSSACSPSEGPFEELADFQPLRAAYRLPAAASAEYNGKLRFC